MYIAFDEPLAGAVPISYALASSLSILVFGLTRHYRFFRFTQLLLILCLPFLLKLALGGFISSSAAVLWSLICPFGALLFGERRQAVGWFLAFLALVILGGVLQPQARFVNNLPPWLILAFFVANIGAVSTIGARLVARHCGQCHNLPGPGHHTAREWRRVAANMFLLSEVTARFGGRPELAIPDAAQRETITAYLERHGLRPLPEGMAAPQAYLSTCGDCHAAPDPKLHSTTAWPAVMARMAGHRAVMTRGPLDPLSATRVLAYLSEYAAPEPQDSLIAGRWAGRWAALTPVLALAGFALWRLVRARRSA